MKNEPFEAFVCCIGESTGKETRLTVTNKELFETYRSDVYRMCYYMLGQSADAEDICQDVFMTAFRSDWASMTNVKAWLLKISVNQCLNVLRRRSNLRSKLTKHSHRLAGSPERTPEEQFQDREGAIEWAEYISRLPIKIRTVISLRFVHDLGINEIAELLHIPQGTVKSRQYKGLKLLRIQLEHAGKKTESIKGGHYEYQPYKG